MTRQPSSPFAGLTLTAPARRSRPGTDQRLFVASPAPLDLPRDGAPEQLPSKEPSQEPRKVGTQTTQPSFSADPTPPPFTIETPATEKNSYMFSQEELWALKDVEAEIERMYRTEVPKYNIVRLGLHMLLEDYFAHKHDSFLVHRLRLTRP